MDAPLSPATAGVLLMAYGTPATPDDIEAYYTHVRRGRPPTAELLDDLRARYDAIGGTSPLLELTRAQAAGVAAALGEGWSVELGMKHAPPFIEEGMARLAEHGVGHVVGLVLAPHYSALSVGEYAARAAAAEAVTEKRVELTMVDSWHMEPGYIDLLTSRVLEAHELLMVTDPNAVEVIFTAHSLPARILEAGDPYPDQLRQTAEAVAAKAGTERWSIAWQSAGRTPEPWIGPDLVSHLAERAEAGIEGVVVCPAGFVSDHLEILYDLDIEAREAAERLGLAFARTELPNDDPAFCATVAKVVAAALPGA